MYTCNIYIYIYTYIYIHPAQCWFSGSIKFAIDPGPVSQDKSFNVISSVEMAEHVGIRSLGASLDRLSLHPTSWSF